MIRILYFASLRERLGIAEEQWPCPEGSISVAEVINDLRRRGGVWAEALGEGERRMMAVNHELRRADCQLVDGDELAIFPPVTGG
ncbi:molybdopterin converting factor subunit 1 [Halochromatium glycolicum]|jgi:molybdopterin converting factor subunit 1|uniref:Molybdopterin synthase sulfur carrier subunit n=1 Tax=Halochromatium glycolicum TaxID=85075 RepID=A0AAJ0U563_9GAMM|nr:molybdopterin converting factor subunit 1 [Halochromatium glycolicum]MBK1704997.1 molybdopterin converting factor subunit 1 [Halochromatium glycolicum]